MKILVTGGASGLGKAITEKLSSEGHRVYFTYCNSKEDASQLESELKNVHAIQCDFSDETSVTGLVERLRQEKDMEVLINNAISGITKNHFHKLTPEEFLESFKTNILSTVRITSQAIVNFRKQKFGKIINILTSYLINVPPAGLSEYVANKAYLESMSKSWATENIKFNITSNCISPSIMRTNLSSDTDERIIEEMIRNHPLQKLLTTEEVAETVSFLCTSTQHINGINLVMNTGSDTK